MLNLKKVTCLAIDNTPRVPDTIKALHTCMDAAEFGEVVLVTSQKYIDEYGDEEGITFVPEFLPVKNIDKYNEYVLYHLYKHIKTEFVLLVQDHAFIINPDAWRDDFFDYDYIGAPWPYSERAFVTPYGEHIRVGNGGFSLRSKKLLEVPQKVPVPFHVADQPNFYKTFGGRNTNEDGNICVHNRHIFEGQGCKIAPLEVAKYFSYEQTVPENHGIIPLGFHGNLPPGVEIEGYNPR